MAPVNGQRDGLRTRCNQDALPLEQLSNQQRGVRAAKEVLQGERTLPQRVGSDFSESDSDDSWNIIHVMQVDNSCTYA